MKRISLLLALLLTGIILFAKDDDQTSTRYKVKTLYCGISLVSEDVYYTWDEDEWDCDQKVLTNDAFFVADQCMFDNFNASAGLKMGKFQLNRKACCTITR